MSWIETLVDSYKESETPTKFIFWSGLASIAAVMQKRVYLDRYIYTLYPNIYVFIIAKSGMKKGTPITLAKKLVKNANITRIVSGHNSMPRIIQDFGKAYSLEGGGIVRDAQGFLVTGELAAFLVKDPDALTMLTDLHNTHEHEDFWENSLKSTGVDKLKSPCLTILGATNEEHFPDAVPNNAIGGGFIARTFIVLSNERGQLNSLTRAPKSIPNIPKLSEHLQELTKVSGEFQWGAHSKDTYDDWYYPFMKTVDGHDPTGTYNRIGDQILKLAMLLALSDGPDLILKESNIVEGITVGSDCIQGMKMVTMGAGKSNLAYQTKIVVQELLNAPDNKLTRANILSKHWGNMTDFDLDRIAETLRSANAIDIIVAATVVTYVMKKETISIYQKAVRGIQ